MPLKIPVVFRKICLFIAAIFFILLAGPDTYGEDKENCLM
jgi:hypothetical protein